MIVVVARAEECLGRCGEHDGSRAGVRNRKRASGMPPWSNKRRGGTPRGRLRNSRDEQSRLSAFSRTWARGPERRRRSIAFPRPLRRIANPHLGASRGSPWRAGPGVDPSAGISRPPRADVGASSTGASASLGEGTPAPESWAFDAPVPPSTDGTPSTAYLERAGAFAARVRAEMTDAVAADPLYHQLAASPSTEAFAASRAREIMEALVRIRATRGRARATIRTAVLRPRSRPPRPREIRDATGHPATSSR